MAQKAGQVRVYDRIKAAFGVAALHALLGYVLITALGIEAPPGARDDLKRFAIAPEPPPPAKKPVPVRAGSKKRSAAASPPNLKAKPSQVVVPPPEIPLVVPPPVIAAPTPGLGGDPSAGAADVAGPGTGSGGQGQGTGSGGNGEGDGNYTAPRRLRGRLRDADYPRAAGDAGLDQTITVRFVVETTGRVTECTVLQSSGNAALDEATCQAIERRYRYEPSRDAHGTAVPSVVVENHTWLIGNR